MQKRMQLEMGLDEDKMRLLLGALKNDAIQGGNRLATEAYLAIR